MNNKQLVFLLAGISAFTILIWWVMSNWSDWGNEKDGNPLMQFVGIMAITIVLGIVFVTVILPMMADKVGEMVYSAPEKVEPDSYSKANAKIAQGDYEGALAGYQQIALDEPENRFPVIEAAKIQQEHLGDTDGAIKTIEGAIQGRDWEVNDAAFMMFRLHDLYLEEKGDKDTARGLLEQVVEQFPETRHSANAHHKINELNQLG